MERIEGRGGWPAVGTEELAWRSALPPELLSRSARAQIALPYRAAVLQPIADLEVSLPRDTAAAAEEATTVIRAFDADVGGELAPFAAILLRSEAAASSRIENLTSGARAIALAEIGEDSRANARQIVGNVAAMRAALGLAESIDAETILSMHRALLGSVDPTIAGRWRTEQVWIGGGGISPHNAAFVPPRAEGVVPAMDDLVAFAARDDVPALTLAAIVHAQFETIHPFADGNGRVGRALVHALLRRRSVTRAVTIPVSAGLLTDVPDYFGALTAYRAGDVSPIVEAMAAAAVRSVDNGRLLVADLRAARARWTDQVMARSDSGVWPLIDLVLRHPVVNSALVRTELGLSHTNAMKAIERLEGAGALARLGGRRRSVLWQAPEVLHALDEFAARAGRRGRGA